MTVSQPLTYAQECLCWADIARKAALPYYALVCLSLWWNIWWFLALVTTGTNDITNSQYLIPSPLPFLNRFFLLLSFTLYLSLYLPSFSLSRSPCLQSCIVCFSVHVKSLYKVFRVLSRKLLASLKKYCMKATVVRITNIIATFQWKRYSYSYSEVFLFHHHLLKPIKWSDYSPNICYYTYILTYVKMCLCATWAWFQFSAGAHLPCSYVLVWVV